MYEVDSIALFFRYYFVPVLSVSIMYINIQQYKLKLLYLNFAKFFQVPLNFFLTTLVLCKIAL